MSDVATLVAIFAVIAWWRERMRRMVAEERLERLLRSVLILNATSNDELVERGG